MNSLFDIPQTGNNNVNDSLFDSCSQYINTSNIHDIAINHNFTNQFLGMSVNMRSLVNTANFTKLEALIFSLPRKPDIIAITETWITPLNSGPYNNLDNYIDCCSMYYTGCNMTAFLLLLTKKITHHFL